MYGPWDHIMIWGNKLISFETRYRTHAQGGFATVEGLVELLSFIIHEASGLFVFLFPRYHVLGAWYLVLVTCYLAPGNYLAGYMCDQ